MQRLLHRVMAACLAVMAVAVFVNVVLRYGIGRGMPAEKTTKARPSGDITRPPRRGRARSAGSGSIR